METIYRVPAGNGFVFVTVDGLKLEAEKLIGCSAKNQTTMAYAAKKFEDELWRLDWCARAQKPPVGFDLAAWAYLLLSATEAPAI